MDDRVSLADRSGPPPATLEAAPSSPEGLIRQRLGNRSIVLVGLMGVGKSTAGRRLAARLAIPFKDADHEIEAAAGMTIADIFALYGEASFRVGEQRVIARLLQHGPCVLATGGGAVMNPETRKNIAAAGISIWLRADLDVLMRRVRKRQNRPLLNTADPEATMRGLMERRDPVYALSDLTVESRDIPHDRVVGDTVAALATFLSSRDRP